MKTYDDTHKSIKLKAFLLSRFNIETNYKSTSLISFDEIPGEMCNLIRKGKL